MGNVIRLLKGEGGHSRTDTVPIIVITYVTLNIVVMAGLYFFSDTDIGWLCILLPIFAPFVLYLFMYIILAVIAFGWRLLRKLRKGE